MRLKLDSIEEGKPGTAVITCEKAEDYQKLSVVIKPNDLIHSKIRRKVKDGAKKGVELFEADIIAKEIQYEAGVEEMRIRGILNENCEAGRAGSNQNVFLINGLEFTLTKEQWTKEEIETLNEAGNNQKVEVAVLVFRPHNCSLMTEEGTLIKTVSAVSQKQLYFTNIARCFSEIGQTLKCIVVFSQNTINREFIQFVYANSKQLHLTEIVKNNAMIEEKTTKGTKEEVLQSMKKESTQAKVNAIVDAELIQAYKTFDDKMHQNSEMVAFDVRDFKKALQGSAVDTLLVTEGFMERLGNDRRERFMMVLKVLTNARSKVFIYPKKCKNFHDIIDKQYNGIAFTLRFKYKYL